MKITVVHGETQIQISGKHSMKKMKRAVKDILSALPQVELEEEEKPNQIGFTVDAITERAEELQQEFFFTDDEWDRSH